MTALEVSRIKKPGKFPTGDNLYLQVSPALTKSWLYRYMLNGTSRWMGLGSYRTFSLAEARAMATDCDKLRHRGVDPIEARKRARDETLLAAARSMTFSQCAAAYIEAHRSGWKNEKHAAQWQSTLNTYADRAFGNLPVQAIDTALVMKALEPIWNKIPETASRLRGRIESVLDWATVRGLRSGDNPARWRGHLDKLLPKRSHAHAVKHYPALPYRDIAPFVEELRKQSGIAARALEFLILTAARTGEVIGAFWSEFDTKEKVWTVPAARMKSKREHRVPLSPRALEVIREMRTAQQGDFVFPGGKRDKPLSNMAMLQLLERMGRDDVTVHGFRSAFRDWAAERTNYPREVAEAALAHVLSDKTEAAYLRGDLFEKRRRLMLEWERFCQNSAGKVLSLSKRSKTAA
jgi:integrase